MKEGTGGITGKQVACATAVFLWDNERITQEDVQR